MPDDFNVIIATDCGSTTTKAILIEKKGSEYRQTFRGEAPTTVEAPFEDVTRGVLNSFAELEELSGRKILDGEALITPAKDNVGVDIYISTSSAGGGLQMMVAGAVKTMTAQSAQKAALGAGAIVMDVIASNDRRLPHEKIERIRQLRPDMILLSGGTDGGTVTHVVELAEYIAAANPRPRLGTTFQLPVIYAGNKEARDKIKDTLEKKTALRITENLRPVLERENLNPARQEIQTLFLEHVMAHAPGYKKLMSWTGAPIMPTPGAVGVIMQAIAKKENINVVGVDIGGATTDVFSVFDGIFNRTVSANYGMSYSISNVVAETGIENIMKWLPFDIDEADIRNRVKNKMIRPTTIPQLLEDLKVEHAIAREALRLSFEQHKSLAVGLKGVQKESDISETFEQIAKEETLIDMNRLNLVVGSGGVLSHAPRRSQAMMMMLDTFQPQGITMIAVDSIFMMPHLGVLSTINEQAATEVFEKDCLINLGTCVSLANTGKPGSKCLDYKITLPDGQEKSDSLLYGELKLIDLKEGETAEIEITPTRQFDVGRGKGQKMEEKVRGGVVGLVIDVRGRPLSLHKDKVRRIEQITKWNKAFRAYPD
ncbi:MAG: glutamate mutase L [Candidatus Scalindua sediminis]|nr:glutamate mutase L [Candidatus Scalindua sediminis]